MKHSARLIIWVTVVLGLCGCMTSRMVFDNSQKLPREPSYEDFFDYYALGFIGRNKVDVAQVCMDQKPLLIEKRQSFEDVLIGVMTLGIYTPLTVRVWCHDLD